MEADHAELLSDLNHVLMSLERLIGADAGARDQADRMAALVRARQRVVGTSDTDTLTDVLTWALAQLEDEERR